MGNGGAERARREAGPERDLRPGPTGGDEGDHGGPRPAPARRRGRRLLGPAVVLGVLAADLATKAWAVRALAEGPVAIVGELVELRLVRNTGGAFSLFQGLGPLLALVALVVAVVLWRVSRRSSDPWVVLALSLILGGALGNLADRVFRAPGFLRGAVIDFVSVWRWPSFNVADAAITVGAVLLVLRGLRRGPRGS